MGQDGGGPKRAGTRWGVDTVSTVVQTAAIVAAGAWGFYTFIYEAQIVPARAPPSVSVTTALERAGERGDLVAVRSTVTRTNVGQTGVRVLALTYNVRGVRIGVAEPGGAEPMARRIPEDAASAAASRYYEEAGVGEVILRQGILFEGATTRPAGASALQPGEAVSRDVILYADRTRFDSIRFLVELSYAKLSEPAIPLVLQLAEDGAISAVPGPGCKAETARCQGLTTTDFATEFSLW